MKSSTRSDLLARLPSLRASLRAGAVFVLVAALFAGGCRHRSNAEDARADGVSAWMNLIIQRVKQEALNPAQASRIYAYVSVAAYEAIVPGAPGRRSLAGHLNQLKALPKPQPALDYDWQSAQSVAILRVAGHLFQSSTTSLASFAAFDSATRAARRAAGVSETTLVRSRDFGEQIGAAINRWSDSDGFQWTRQLTYKKPVGPQHWVPTNELSTALQPAEPYWGNLRTFAVPSAETCMPQDPEPYSESPDSSFFAQAKATHDAVTSGTQEQREIAQFWADLPGQTGTPPGHWLSLVGQLVAERSLVQASEAYALTSVALADAFIACWKAKYSYSLVRPETYIQRFIDSTWRPLLQTPLFPEYPSGHSVASAAAATVLAAVLGQQEFTDRTADGLGQRSRHFSSFAAAAEEAAISRVYAGIHYPMASRSGLLQGRCVGDRVLSVARSRPAALSPAAWPSPTPVGSVSQVSKASVGGTKLARLELAKADEHCGAASDGSDCMACCEQAHPRASEQVREATRACICSEASSACHDRCPGYCSGKADDRSCYSCAYRLMAADSSCFRPVLQACKDDDCLDFLSCRASCANVKLAR